MEAEKNKLKGILYFLLLGGLLMPLIQQRLMLYKSKPLMGAYSNAEDVYITKEGWFSGEYQEKQEAFLNENVGFRPEMVRLYNQWHYNLYGEAKANGVVIGKDNVLYEENYIKAYMGTDFVGEDVIRLNVQKLKAVSDTLQRMGKHVLVVLAPGKGSFYPEFIPDNYFVKGTKNRNHGAYRAELKKVGLHVLDANTWFREMKESSGHCLYGRTAIHWSRYAQLLVSDSLMRRIETIASVKLPEIHIDAIERTTEARMYDDDIEKGMNLLFDIPDYEMSYPTFHMDSTGRMDHIRLLTVGDSYFWEMFESELIQQVFKHNQFWYYNEDIHTAGRDMVKARDVNLEQSIESTDVIMLICTDANLPRFGFGIIDQLYDQFCVK